MKYHVVKLGSMYVKELNVDYWGYPEKIIFTRDILEAERITESDRKWDAWKKFTDKNEILNIVEITLKEESK
jgi:hypothetical protein